MRAAALMSSLLVLSACEAVPDISFAPVDADASNEADARTRDAKADAVIDAHGANDVGTDSTLTCPSTHPSGTDGCCGNWACVKEVCANCSDCTQAGCSPSQTCCPQYNGGGKYKGVSCSVLPCQ